MILWAESKTFWSLRVTESLTILKFQYISSKAFPAPVTDRTCGSGDVKRGKVPFTDLESVEVGRHAAPWTPALLSSRLPLPWVWRERDMDKSLLNCRCWLFLDDIYWLFDRHAPHL